MLHMFINTWEHAMFLIHEMFQFISNSAKSLQGSL